MEIPDWLKEEENYHACKGSDSFLSKSLLSFGAALTRFEKIREHRNKPQALVFLLFLVISILFMSLSLNMLFTYILLAVVIVCLCLMKEKDMAYIMHYACRAFLISCLLLLPSVFLSNKKTMLTVSLKVFVSTCFVCMFNLFYSTNEIISCLKALHVPDVFIYTMDTTFKYIVMLSKSCEEILNALQCRMIGQRKKKDTSVMNVAGMTYIRSQKYSEEMAEAMKCRGFTGEYYNHMKFRMQRYDWVCIVFIIGEMLMFIFLRG